jgi:hypothetical protein
MPPITAPEGNPAMAAGPRDMPPCAGHIVGRVLLRHGIAIDVETAQLVADAVHAALQAAPPSPPRRAGGMFLPAAVSRSSDPAHWWHKGGQPGA